MKRKNNYQDKFNNKKNKNNYSLHIDGFEIINYEKINNKVINQAKKLADKNSYIIFNDHFNGGDDKRSQSFINDKYEDLNDWKKYIINILKEKYPKLTPNDAVVIKSISGCRNQIPHCDYEQDLNFATTPDEEIPLGCLICIMKETKLNVWIKSHRLAYLNDEITSNIKPIKKSIIKLIPGDILVFRGDLVHSGASYDEDNYRIHMFLDSGKVNRKNNTTWFMNNVDYIKN